MAKDKITLWKRRKEMFRRIQAGYTPSQVAKNLSSNPKNDYEVGYQTIMNDWKNRDDWLPVLFMFEDEEKFKQNIIGDIISEKERLTRLAETTSNENIELGASKAKARINEKLLDVAHDAGLLSKQPEKDELELSGDFSFYEMIKEAQKEKEKIDERERGD